MSKPPIPRWKPARSEARPSCTNTLLTRTNAVILPSKLVADLLTNYCYDLVDNLNDIIIHVMNFHPTQWSVGILQTCTCIKAAVQEFNREFNNPNSPSRKAPTNHEQAEASPTSTHAKRKAAFPRTLGIFFGSIVAVECENSPSRLLLRLFGSFSSFSSDWFAEFNDRGRLTRGEGSFQCNNQITLNS